MPEDEEPHLGQTWTELTVVGVRPSMEVVELVPYRSWAERGTWRAVSAELTLIFEPTATGCRVSAETLVRGPLVGRVLTALAPYAVRGDLAQAARILSERASGK